MAQSERSAAQKSLEDTEEDHNLWIQELLATSDWDKVHVLTQSLQSYIQHQQSLIKKLASELELECGHTNALRTENMSLRQMTVTMVLKCCNSYPKSKRRLKQKKKRAQTNYSNASVHSKRKRKNSSSSWSWKRK